MKHIVEKVFLAVAFSLVWHYFGLETAAVYVLLFIAAQIIDLVGSEKYT